MRSQLVSNVDYALRLTLYPGSSHFPASADIRFDYHGSKAAEEPPALFFDFVGASILSLTVNGTSCTSSEHPDKLTGAEYRFSDNRVWLPQSLLNKSQNKVTVCYVNAYNHDGKGFHQFVDPEDDREYLFTDFEPFECHRLFPCFDQPDLRASMDLSVAASKTWTVSANAPCRLSKAKEYSISERGGKKR